MFMKFVKSEISWHNCLGIVVQADQEQMTARILSSFKLL